MSYNKPLNEGPCFLYALVDPRTGAMFYIGVSWDPDKRLANHRGDRASSAFWRVREIEAAGFDVEVDVLETWPTRSQAEKRERLFISTIPDLVNRDRRAA